MALRVGQHWMAVTQKDGEDPSPRREYVMSQLIRKFVASCGGLVAAFEVSNKRHVGLHDSSG